MKKNALLLWGLLCAVPLVHATTTESWDIVNEEIQGANFAIEQVNAGGDIVGVGTLQFFPSMNRAQCVMFRSLFDEKPGARDAVFYDVHELNITQWEHGEGIVTVSAAKSGSFQFTGYIKRNGEFDYKINLQSGTGDVWRTLTDKGREFKKLWIPTLMFQDSFIVKKNAEEIAKKSAKRLSKDLP